jgi:FkbM family methyltransferase
MTGSHCQARRISTPTALRKKRASTTSGDISARELLARAYAFVFARPGRAQAVNHALYYLALRGQGFNNTYQFGGSGEAWFIDHVLAPAYPSLCIDVGANKGDYSRMLLSKTPARVVAFEPLSACRPALEALADDYQSRMTVVPHAAGSQPGVMTIHYGDKTELASLAGEVSAIDYVAEVNTRAAPVRVTTLDRYLDGVPRIDFLKIDAEGFEFEVLLGARETLEHRRPLYVQIEMNLHQLYRGHTLRSLGALLKGYAPFQLLPRGLRAVDLDDPEANTFAYSNFVFADRQQQHLWPSLLT